MTMSNERLEAEIEHLRTQIGTVELTCKRAVTDARDETGRALKTARDQAAADLETFSTKIADLAVNAGAQISEAKQQFQDQRELCQKHAYGQREDLEARIDADLHRLTERIHHAESLPPISDAAKFVEACQDVKDQLLQNRKAFEREFSRLQAKVGADIHALSQRVHRAESLPPISDAQDILAQADDVKNTCDDNRKAFEEDFSRLQSRLQTNIGSLTMRVRTLESGPAPWDTTAIERKQGNLRLRVEALERTANAHPDTDHEVFANDFARVDERLDVLEANATDWVNTTIDEAKEQLREDLVAHQDRLKHQAEASHLEHEVRIQSLERRADAGRRHNHQPPYTDYRRTPGRPDPDPAVPADDLPTAIGNLIREHLDTMNLAILQEHPAWFPSFTTNEKARPEPRT